MVETLARPEATTPRPEEDGPGPLRRLLTREEYHRMAEAGIFGPDERIELIHGEVYHKVSPQKSSHFFVIHRVAAVLTAIFSEGFIVRQQGPLRFEEDSEPEPDVSVVPGRWEDYTFVHPRLIHSVLVVEVADTSLRSDRTIKAALYAQAGVQDYWIVNLTNGTVEVYREPDAAAGPKGYKSRRIYTAGESLSPLAAPETSIPVADILPPA